MALQEMLRCREIDGIMFQPASKALLIGQFLQ